MAEPTDKHDFRSEPRSLGLEEAQELGYFEAADWLDEAMEQVQVFASAWSLVGGRFDNGNALEEAEKARAELRAMLTLRVREDSK